MSWTPSLGQRGKLAGTSVGDKLWVSTLELGTTVELIGLSKGMMRSLKPLSRALGVSLAASEAPCGGWEPMVATGPLKTAHNLRWSCGRWGLRAVAGTGLCGALTLIHHHRRWWQGMWLPASQSHTP